MFYETLNVASDGILHHRSGFFDGIALSNQPRKRGNRDDIPALYGGLKNGRVVILWHVGPFLLLYSPTGGTAMLDGFYALFYTGKISSGFAMIVLRNGIVTGADVSGGLYDGKYTINADKLTVDGTMKLTMPPGIPLVTGAPASPQTSSQEFPFSLPADFNEKTVQVQTPTGPVNLRFRKIRDFPS